MGFAGEGVRHDVKCISVENCVLEVFFLTMQEIDRCGQTDVYVLVGA